jgi:hypothetical protein
VISKMSGCTRQVWQQRMCGTGCGGAHAGEQRRLERHTDFDRLERDAEGCREASTHAVGQGPRPGGGRVEQQRTDGAVRAGAREPNDLGTRARRAGRRTVAARCRFAM